jgi:hypothetical protein
MAAMEEAYVVCQERNTEAAFRRFFGPRFRYYPDWRQVARLALRHPVTAGLIVVMNAGGFLAYLLRLF